MKRLLGRFSCRLVLFEESSRWIHSSFAGTDPEGTEVHVLP
jgi:hypothetical protein